jgi:NAD+ diphosphatase
LSKKTFISGVTPPDVLSASPLWFAFSGNELLVYDDEDSPEIIPTQVDFSQFGLKVVRQQYLGTLEGQPCFSVELETGVSPPPGMSFQNLRQLFNRLDEDLSALAGRAVQIVDWDRNHQFCSRCGARTKALETERVKKCPQCGLLTYPRLSPCIIVLIRRDNELLLARGRRWASGWYSLIAGFVEPGETLEEAVRREVMEEVGIEVKNIQYFGSQPWPFPNSLMTGFTAEYAGGELRLEEAEIADAGWFTVDNMPNTPTKVSISGQLIAAFVAEQKGNQ